MVKCGKNLGNMRSPAFAHMVKSQSFFRWHLTTGANAGTRIKPDFFSHLTIWKFQVEGWSSAAVRGRTGQAALLRSARAGVAPQACRCVAARAKPPSRLRQGRGVPGKPAARTCTILSIKRGVQPPLRGAKRQRRHSAADVRQRPAQAQASARRSVARMAQREHPPRDGKEKDLTDENLLCYTGSTSKKRFFFCACFSEGGRGENAPKIFP